jgi:hypothetical protein
VRIGCHLTPFWDPATRDASELIDEAVRLAGVSRMGYAWVSTLHHWLGAPPSFPQPVPILARLVPETGRLRFNQERSRSMGLDGIGFTMCSLPKDVQARIAARGARVATTRVAA